MLHYYLYLGVFSNDIILTILHIKDGLDAFEASNPSLIRN